MLWCTPKADELLAEWSLKGNFELRLIFHEEACRKSWEGLGLQSLKGGFHLVAYGESGSEGHPQCYLAVIV